MKITKEKCERALEWASTCYFEDTEGNQWDFKNFNDYKVLEQLIKEHFDLLEEYKKLEKSDESKEQCTIEQYALIHELRDEIKELKSNPPLKFEEIKVGQWVWIAETKEYVKVHRKYISDFRNSSYPENTKIIKFIYHNGFCFSQRYEENRFYRMEVKE